MGLTILLRGSTDDLTTWTEINNVRLRVASSENDSFFFELSIKLSFLCIVMFLVLYLGTNSKRQDGLMKFYYTTRFAIFNPVAALNSTWSRCQRISYITQKRTQNLFFDFQSGDDATLNKLIGVEEYARLEYMRRGKNFTYSPLRAEKSDIRLLYLLSGSKDDLIRVNVVHTSLRTAGVYDALSYTWGDSEKPIPILVNGYTHKVQPNLASALSHLRQVKDCRRNIPLWIDALSIDQSNIPERNQQVRLMTKIFEQATKVYVWLGVPTEETELAMAKLQAIEAVMVNALSQKSSDLNPRDEVSTRHFLGPDKSWEQDILPVEIAIVGGLPFQPLSTFSEPWEAMIAVLTNPFWTRVWMLQELTCPAERDVDIILGRQLQTLPLRRSVMPSLLAVSLLSRKSTISQWAGVCDILRRVDASWNYLRNVSEVARSRRRRLPTYSMSNFRPDRRSTKVSALERDLWRHEILPTLESIRLQDSTDPRDKIYATYAITLDASDPGFKPDYSLAVAEVYCKFVSDFIARTGSLDILASCIPNSEDLPSWIPDWRKRSRTVSLAGLFNSKGEPIYESSGKSAPKYSIRMARERLTVTGITIDILQSCSDSHLDLAVRRQHRWEAMLGDTCRKYNFTDETTWDAYLRTIVADHQQGLGVSCFDESPWYHRILETTANIVRRCGSYSTPISRIRMSDIHLLDFTPAYLQRVCKRNAKAFYHSTKDAATWHQDGNTEGPEDYDSSSKDIPGAGIEKHDTMKAALETATLNRHFAISHLGYIGLVSQYAHAGDLICIILGAVTPYVLRPIESAGEICYELVGDCYIHGLMDGEGMALLAKGQAKTTEFVLV